MTLTSAIIFSGFRESNIKGIQAALTDLERSEGLDRLNVVVAGVFGNEVGDPFIDWPIDNEDLIFPPSWTASQWMYPIINTRLIACSLSSQDIYFPPNPPPGARVSLIDPADRLAAAPITLHGNGRTIGGSAEVLVNTNGTNMTWFYRDDLGDWVVINALTGVDPEPFPFPNEFDDYFITRLAMRINPRYGRSMAQETVAELQSTLQKLEARYTTTMSVPADLGVLALTSRPAISVGPTFGDNPSWFSQYGIVRGYMGWNR